jgi:uncharacterized protein (UPF0210 family)
MGISLRDCAHTDVQVCCAKIYDKVTTCAKDLVAVASRFNGNSESYRQQAHSVTPDALVAESCRTYDYVPLARALDSAAKTVGVNFIVWFSPLVHKGFTPGDRKLIDALPEALAGTERVCASVNVATTRAGINRMPWP